MPILGFNLNKLLVEKNNPVRKDLKVNQNITINSLTKTKSELTSSDLLNISFEFNLDYQEVGQLILGGEIIFSEEAKRINEILDEWKKNHRIQKELNQLILNTILLRCTIKALNLQQELNLPHHIQLPKLKPA